jgi:hypothetical protein
LSYQFYSLAVLGGITLIKLPKSPHKGSRNQGDENGRPVHDSSLSVC